MFYLLQYLIYFCDYIEPVISDFFCHVKVCASLTRTIHGLSCVHVCSIRIRLKTRRRNWQNKVV